MAEKADRLFVTTGGPGAGKSTLIEALARAGYATTVEAGRGIIQDQVAIGGSALPWDDYILFAEVMLSWEMRSYHMAEREAGPVFFDRGVPDALGFLRLLGKPLPAYMHKAAEIFRYNRRVFIAPPWQEIFRPDRERKQGFEEAQRTYAALFTTYLRLGYDLVELPRASVEERLRFVLQNIGSSSES